MDEEIKQEIKPGYMGPRLTTLEDIKAGCFKEKAICFFSLEELSNGRIKPFISDTCISDTIFEKYKNPEATE